MNFWLLAFAIGYPPKIQHPSSKSKQREPLQKEIVELLSRNGKPFFTQITNFIFSRQSRVRQALEGECLPTQVDAGQHQRSSRGRGSSWRCLPSRFPNDRFKLRAHRRSQFIYDLEKIHFSQPLRTPQQKGQRARGFGSRIVFANPVE